MNCEECEEVAAKFNCNQCGQYLCESCDKKIHNKGKRVLHQRERVGSIILSQELSDCPENQDSGSTKLESNKSVPLIEQQKPDPHMIRHEQHKERFKQITQIQGNQKQLLEKDTHTANLPQVYLANLDSVDIPDESEMRFQNNPVIAQIEQYIYKQAHRGELMIHFNEINRFLKSHNILKINQNKDVIAELEKIGMINVTIRRFGDSDPIKFISLALNRLSLQSLYWILLSIRKDEMTPTDKLVMSRIKECFGLKISVHEWNHHIAGFYKRQDQNGILGFQINQFKQKEWVQTLCRIKMIKCPIDLVNKSENQTNTSLSASQSINNDSLLLFTIEDGNPWNMIDAQAMTPKFKNQWKLFINFLKDFFDSNYTLLTSQNTQSQADLNHSIASNSSKTSGAQSVPTQNQDNSKWVRSVETGAQRQEQMNVSQLSEGFKSCQLSKKKNKKTQIKPPKSIQKAIPGGKYGCAQLVKYCGPLELRICSLGVLCMIIQEAINRQVLIYYKTLLIKPNTNIAFDFADYLYIFDDIKSENILNQTQEEQMSMEKIKQHEDQKKKLQIVQRIIKDILLEYKKGVSLARLPKLIQRKLTFPFDLHELGFTKLKLLIQSIENVTILNDGTTFASIIIDNQQLQQPSTQTNHQQQFQAPQQHSHFNGNIQQVQPHMISNQFDEYIFRNNPYKLQNEQMEYIQQYQFLQQKSNSQFRQLIYHQKSQSTNLPNYTAQLIPAYFYHNGFPQQPVRQQSSHKADSFLADMHPDTQSHSSTFPSFHTNQQGKEVSMIQEESSQNEIDANVRFIEELLKESDETDLKNIYHRSKQLELQQKREIKTTLNMPAELHSWDFDN